MTELTTEELHLRLREWASGWLTLTAAVELLIRTHGGRFASQPYVQVSGDGHPWIDSEKLCDHLGVLSGSEGRTLTLVASLVEDAPGGVATMMRGLDAADLIVTLQALAYTSGREDAFTQMTVSSPQLTSEVELAARWAANHRQSSHSPHLTTALDSPTL